MDIQKRPLGITALAFTSVLVGLYCLVAAIALLLGGTIGGAVSADNTAAIIAIGALYIGSMAAAFLVGYGFWSRRHWSWAGGIVVFGAFIVVSVLLALMSTALLSAIAPALGAGVAIWYLLRPETKAQLLGVAPAEEATEAETPAAAPPLDTPQVVH